MTAELPGMAQKRPTRPGRGSWANGCSACGRMFASVQLFDRHRRDFECVDPATLGMVTVDGVWVTR